MLTRPKFILKSGLNLWRVGLLCGCGGLLAPCNAGQQKLSVPSSQATDAHLLVREPVPRWIAPIQAESLRATPDTLLVMSQGGLTALDRQDGRTLWQIEGVHSTVDQGNLRIIDTKVTTVVGVTAPNRTPQVAVLLSSQEYHKLDMTHYENRKQTWQAELEGKELRTGRRLWHTALALDPRSEATEISNHLIWQPLDVYGETIILHKWDAPAIALFQDARTGARLDSARSQDRSVLQSSAALHGEKALHWDTLRDGTLLRLDPNALSPVKLSPTPFDGLGGFLGRTGNKFVWLVIGDDGWMGHSIYPNYLVCYDVKGKKLWQFPKKTVDTSNANALLENPRLLGDGVLDPLGRAVLAQDRGGQVYRLNVRTGGIVSKRSGDRIWNLLPYGHGYIEYDSAVGVMRYLEGRSGKVEKVVRLRLGNSSSLLLAGSDFVFEDWKGKLPQLLYYTAQDLLGP